MWHDEPRELLFARSRMQAVATIVFALVVLAVFVETQIPFRWFLAVIVTLTMLNRVADIIWSPKTVAERILKERSRELDGLEPIKANLSIAQDAFQTGSDQVLMWLKDARLRLEGCEVSISLTTNDFVPEVKSSLVESTLQYQLDDRCYCITIRPVDVYGVDTINQVIHRWLCANKASGESQLPLDIQPSFYQHKGNLTRTRITLLVLGMMFIGVPALALGGSSFFPIALVILISTVLGFGYYYWKGDDQEMKMLVAGHEKITELNKGLGSGFASRHRGSSSVLLHKSRNVARRTDRD